MMFTHDEMLSAVRTAGENGRTFTCGAVRDCLGVKSGDREKMNQFHRRFRSFQKEAADEIEKVGKNAYRLKHPERAGVEAPVIAHVAEAVAEQAAEAEALEVAHVTEQAAEAEALEVAPEELMEVVEPAASETPAIVAPEPAIRPLPPAPAPAEPPPSSMEVPFRMIEIDFQVKEPPPLAPATPAQPVIRAWLDRGQRLGRRVAEFFGRA